MGPTHEVAIAPSQGSQGHRQPADKGPGPRSPRPREVRLQPGEGGGPGERALAAPTCAPSCHCAAPGGAGKRHPQEPGGAPRGLPGSHTGKRPADPRPARLTCPPSPHARRKCRLWRESRGNWRREVRGEEQNRRRPRSGGSWGSCHVTPPLCSLTALPGVKAAGCRGSPPGACSLVPR